MNEAIERLSTAVDLAEVQAIVRSAARSVVDADGATVVLRDGEQCFYADEDAMSPLWKGQRFPLTQCISGWAMLNREVAVIPDVFDDERIPVEAYRPTFVQSLAMVPVGSPEPAAAIGVYWADRGRAAEADVEPLERLAEATAAAIARVRTPGVAVAAR